MADQLDTTQPYGQVFNDPEGRFYEQGGLFYTASGALWSTTPDAAAAPSGKKKPATQVDAQLADPAPAPQEQP